jgi:hypothetical protein
VKVKAIKKGYFSEQIKEPGVVFECSVEAFSDAIRKTNPPGWMEIVEASPEEMKAVEEKRAKDGIRKNAPPVVKGSAKDLGVGKSAVVQHGEPVAPAESKPAAGKGGTGSKDVLGAGK